MTSDQQRTLAVLSLLHNHETVEAQMAGSTLICRVDGEEGVWSVDADARFIREPDGRVTDLAELSHLAEHPEDFASDPRYDDPPDDEYEAEFTGRSIYRASTASDDDLMGRGLDNDAWSFAAQAARDDLATRD